MEKFNKNFSVSSNESQINEISLYFKENFREINQVGHFLGYKIGEKINSSLSTVMKKFAEQEIKLDIDLIIGEFNANTFLKKLS